MKNKIIYFISVSLVILTATFAVLLITGVSKISEAQSIPVSLGTNIKHNFKSIDEIKSDYTNTNGKVRILIVPGHEPDFGGAMFGKLKERDMTLELGQDLQKKLEKDSHYQVFIARDKQGWSPVFASYFKDNGSKIAEWIRSSSNDFSRLVSTGSTTKTYSTVNHNRAPKDVALHLYGLTKWSNENNIDIVIHIHFNDSNRSNANRVGEYSGLSMYVPAKQYGNSTSTRVIAESILGRLGKYNPVSDLPGETIGIIDEPELIAIGVDNTSSAASLLIEYSYIYEPQFRNLKVRSVAIKDLALQTYLGLQDFFDSSKKTSLTKSNDTLLFPYKWKASLLNSKSKTSNLDVFALQTALMLDSVYPPINKSKNDCPRTGIMGVCTKAALSVFQEKHGITGEKGTVGKKTLQVLNKIY